MQNSPLSPAEKAFLGFARLLKSQLPENVARSPLPVRATRTRRFKLDDEWEWVAGNEPDIPHLFKLFDLQSMNREAPFLRACVQSYYRDGLLPMPGMSDNEGKTIENPTDRQLAGAIIYSLIWPFWHACAEENSIDPSDQTEVQLISGPNFT